MSTSSGGGCEDVVAQLIGEIKRDRFKIVSLSGYHCDERARDFGLQVVRLHLYKPTSNQMLVVGQPIPTSHSDSLAHLGPVLHFERQKLEGYTDRLDVWISLNAIFEKDWQQERSVLQELCLIPPDPKQEVAIEQLTLLSGAPVA